MYTTGPLPVCQYEMEIKSLGKLRRGQKSVAEIHIPFAASYDPSQQRFPPAPNWRGNEPCAAPTATGHPEWWPLRRLYDTCH